MVCCQRLRRWLAPRGPAGSGRPGPCWGRRGGGPPSPGEVTDGLGFAHIRFLTLLHPASEVSPAPHPLYNVRVSRIPSPSNHRDGFSSTSWSKGHGCVPIS
eukprot:EG_transcript_44414